MKDQNEGAAVAEDTPVLDDLFDRMARERESANRNLRATRESISQLASMAERSRSRRRLKSAQKCLVKALERAKSDLRCAEETFEACEQELATLEIHEIGAIFHECAHIRSKGRCKADLDRARRHVRRMKISVASVKLAMARTEAMRAELELEALDPDEFFGPKAKQAPATDEDATPKRDVADKPDEVDATKEPAEAAAE